MLAIFEDDRLYPRFVRFLVVAGSEEEMVVVFRCSHTLTYSIFLEAPSLETTQLRPANIMLR